MEIEIVGEPVASCRVDMEAFKAHFSTTLDLMKSVEHSLEIRDIHARFTADHVLKYVQYCTDWMGVFLELPERNEKYMEVKFYVIQYKDKVEYFPGALQTDGRKFQIVEEWKDGVDILMVNSLSNPNADIKAYLDSTMFNYGNRKWKAMLNE